ncbi:MAG: hypothetical protein LBU81_04880 [Methanosarcinales archaeon]|jgi:Flp pilus assembly protein protease CpaA|nr:hypothetical protein [Methanosarcinales archaeon]
MDSENVLMTFSVLKSVLLFILLCAAAVLDFRSLSVSDHLWVAGLFILFPLLAAEIFIVGASRFFEIFISVGLFFLLFAVCFFLRFFGGADGKAFLLISIAFPAKIPDFFNFFDLFSSVPAAALFNALVLSLIFMISFFAVCFFKEGHCFDRQNVFSKAPVFGRQISVFPFPFLPSIAGGFILAICGVNLFCFLFYFLL